MAAHLIVNPTAGRGDQVERLIALARRHEPVLTVHHTEGSGDAVRFARLAVESRCDLLILAGGDGTVSEAINGLAPDFDAMPLLIVPLGTGNDFARTLNLPPQPEEAIELLCHGCERRVDLIHVLAEGGGICSTRRRAGSARWFMTT